MPALALLLGNVIAGVLVKLAEQLVYRVLAALAIGVVSFVGIGAAVNQVKSMVYANLAAAGPVMDFMGLFGFGVVINIMFSAILMRLTLSGLSASGNITKMIGKGK